MPEPDTHFEQEVPAQKPTDSCPKPRLERPQHAIDAFLAAIKGRHEVLLRGYQIGVRKTAGALGPPT